ncbi:unnamed protein product [Prorocentrum cordatum]|uniref:RRM domain-containing protein n=1 Tax=Prorocentrum cordatum TaxID=2364126 RepID=A0ABN9TYS3_9DINO|nr:unnamed protein product [Polarella glacialis]
MPAEADEDAGRGVGGAAAAMAAAAAAMAGAQAKVAAASTDAAEPGVPELPREGSAGAGGGAAAAPAAVAKKDHRDAPGARFFIRGVGKLGEHHLQDYFQKFGEVQEATLVRDKKTQRPRGMAFVTIAVQGEAAHSELVDKITGETHTVNDQELEIQDRRALPKPDKEEPDGADGKPVAGMAAPAGQAAAATRPAAEAEAEPAAAVEDPAAQANAQAQWEMHYLAMAINTSVPEIKSTTEDSAFAKAKPPVKQGVGAGGKGKSKGHKPY